MSDQPQRPISADWLALREPADTRARDGAAPALLPALLVTLPRPQDGNTLRVVDLGAGTGANLRWLAPRLPFPATDQSWLLVDHDPHLLARGTGHPEGVRVESVRADVTDLADLLTTGDGTDGAGGAGTDLVTAAALLDLLDTRELTAVVEAVVDAGVPALFSLTVDGTADLDPAEEQDDVLAAAFDAHQQRDGRPGPGAGAVVAAMFRERGWRVLTESTPWRLSSADEPQLVDAWLEGRVEAAVEQDPRLAGPAASWLGRRRTQALDGQLGVTVGHLDVLAVPDQADVTERN